MAESSSDKKRRYAQYKSKAHIHNSSKYPAKQKFRYGAYVDKICAGYWHNGIWRVQI